MSLAERRSATIAGAIASGADKKGVAAAVAATKGEAVAHPPGDFAGG